MQKRRCKHEESPFAQTIVQSANEHKLIHRGIKKKRSTIRSNINHKKKVYRSVPVHLYNKKIF